MNPGFIRLRRDDGRFALVRVDQITHILENQVKDRSTDEFIPVLTLMLPGNIAVHVRLTEAELMRRMSEAAGGAKLVVIDAG